jgi:hypothetical protein
MLLHHARFRLEQMGGGKKGDRGNRGHNRNDAQARDGFIQELGREAEPRSPGYFPRAGPRRIRAQNLHTFSPAAVHTAMDAAASPEAARLYLSFYPFCNPPIPELRARAARKTILFPAPSVT